MIQIFNYKLFLLIFILYSCGLICIIWLENNILKFLNFIKIRKNYVLQNWLKLKLLTDE